MRKESEAMQTPEETDRACADRTVLYLRVSSEMQKDQGTSIPSQRSELEAFAASRGWPVVGEYVDEAESARTDDRPQFQLMMHDATVERRFDRILVYSFDRFARNRLDAALNRGRLKKAGVQLTSRTEPTDDTPVGGFVEAIFDATAEYYSKNLSHLTRRGQREIASRGFLPGGSAPFGYKIKKVADGAKWRASLEPHPAHANVLLQIFSKRAAGISRREIADWLDGLGIPPPRRTRWSDRTIDEITANEVYLGTLRFNRKPSRSAPHLRENPKDQQIVIENAFPSLVQKELFDAANCMRRSRRNANVRQHHRHVYLLTGLVKCALCGGQMTSWNADNRHDRSRRYRYYVCKNRRKGGLCDSPRVRCDAVDAAVLDKLRSQSIDDEALHVLWNDILKDSTDPALCAARKAINDKTSRRSNLVRALEEGESAGGSRSIVDRIKALEAEIGDLEVRLYNLEESRKAGIPQSMSELRTRLSQVETQLYSVDRKELRFAIHGFVAEIVLDSRARKARVAYILPMRRSAVLSNGNCGGVI